MGARIRSRLVMRFRFIPSFKWAPVGLSAGRITRGNGYGHSHMGCGWGEGYGSDGEGYGDGVGRGFNLYFKGEWRDKLFKEEL